MSEEQVSAVASELISEEEVESFGRPAALLIAIQRAIGGPGAFCLSHWKKSRSWKVRWEQDGWVSSVGCLEEQLFGKSAEELSEFAALNVRYLKANRREIYERNQSDAMTALSFVNHLKQFLELGPAARPKANDDQPST